jgi:hypothetical protein
MLLSQEKFKHCLTTCLQHLAQMSENPLLDFHTDYGHTKQAIQAALGCLENAESLNYEVCTVLASNLGFRRMYPLFELVDKTIHIEEQFLPELDRETRRLEAWGISPDEIAVVLKEYPGIVKNAFYELVFRKAVSETEVDAIRGIRYSMGNRFAEEYFYNLIKGWPYEDIVARWLDKKLSALQSVTTVQRKNLAHDQDRVVRFRRRPTGEANFVVTLTLEGEKTLWFYLEVQTATERTVRTRTMEVQVPEHRISQSRQAGGGKYLIVFPFKSGEDLSGASDTVAFVVDPHKCCREERDKTLVKAQFLSPIGPSIDSELEKVVAMLIPRSSP